MLEMFIQPISDNERRREDMQTISINELNQFLLSEACAHTATWLGALRWSPARSALCVLLRRTKAMLPQMNLQKGVADEAQRLVSMIEIIGHASAYNAGIPQHPSTLWPEEFGQNPWDDTDGFPHIKQGKRQVLWERWCLRQDSFYVLTKRIQTILRAIETFDEPSSSNSCMFDLRFPGNVASGYAARYCLTEQITVPDITQIEGKINRAAIRKAVKVEWLHIENNEGAKYDKEELAHIRHKAWEQGIRGNFFAQPNRKVEQQEVKIIRPPSDIRLRHWLPYEGWDQECHSIIL